MNFKSIATSAIILFTITTAQAQLKPYSGNALPDSIPPATPATIPAYQQEPAKAADSEIDFGQIHGDFMSDFQTYQADTIINAAVPPQKMGSNNYMNLLYYRGKLTAGVRFEAYYPALQGFDQRYSGVGMVYRFANYKFDDLEITAGNFYEQFGSGMALRTYWDWNLGYDNSIDGFRAKYTGIRGMTIKGLIGNQRFYFDKGPGLIRGIDGEVDVKRLLNIKDYKTTLTVGGSFVSKFQKDDDPLLKLPENVGLWSYRAALTGGRVGLQVEYTYKINDPSASNRYIYHYGEALLIGATYTGKGLGISLQAKHLDNMNYRSDRGAILPQDLMINYLPAISPQVSYRLPTLYPYVTQINGEIGFQGEINYKIKPTNTKILLNVSIVNNIDTTRYLKSDSANYPIPGYKSAGIVSDFKSFGKDQFYRNINLEVNQKISNKFKVVLSYYYIMLNNNFLRLTLSEKPEIVHSHTGIADISYKFASRKMLRVELQHLATKQDYGNWAMVLAELTVSHAWSFSLMDEYNYGNEESYKRIHYFSGNIAYTKGTTRISLAYGKRRQGLLCVGGVCRVVPATNGLSLNLSSSF